MCEPSGGGMMCVGADATVPSGHCNPDLKPTSSWTQPLALKHHWEREISLGGKAWGGFRRGFLGGDVTWSAGLDHSSKSGSVCTEGPVLSA